MRIPIINRFTCSPYQLPLFINNLKKQNLVPILDYTNENKNDFDMNFFKLNKLIDDYSNNTIALKLSSLNINNDYNYALKKSDILIKKAIKNNSKILIDAEDFLIQDKISEISNIMLAKYNKYNVNVYKTYQMYRRDSLLELQHDINNSNNLLGCKLVRGAYYNKDAQYKILYDKIEDTHLNYNNGIHYFINNAKINDKLLCATHNEDSIDLAMSLDKNNNIEYAQLMGMSDKLSNKLVNKNQTVYKYLPYGNFIETVPYLIRRLYENYPMIINFIK
jgi:proline dehydrogenase